MDKQDYHARIEAPELRDYGVYLKCDQLLACQKPLSEMVNADELQFQIVHQVEELWMKLIAYTLVDVMDYLERQDTHRIVTLMGRVHRLMRMMTAQLDLLETMSKFLVLGMELHSIVAAVTTASAQAIRRS